MTYVIALPCVDLKDKACIEECPVDCIYEGERMLYIHPDECVDCGACEPVCPVEAIYYEDDVPAEWSDYTAANAEFFNELGSPGGAAKLGLIASDAKFMGEREDISAYVRGLKAGEGLSEDAIRAGYEKFKADKATQDMAALSQKHGLPVAQVQAFVDGILSRRIFDGEALTELLAPLDLGWKARAQKELALMHDLLPLLKKRAGGREIAGLKAYEA